MTTSHSITCRGTNGGAHGTVRQRLAALGVTLPEPHAIEYQYIPVSIHGATAFLAGQIPKTGSGEILLEGRVGDGVTLDRAQDAACLAVQQGLAWLDARAGGLDNVARILRMDLFVAVDDSFHGISEVADPASALLVHAYGEAGRHPRSVLGVSRLPRNSPVLVELTVALHQPPAEG